jgi:ATP-binding cassette subfamily B protein RaxB
MECAKRCNIHDEIMKMAMGYETIVGELGWVFQVGKSSVS